MIMPIYTFECKECNTEFEIKMPVAKIKENIKCIKPKCKGELKKLMDAPTFRITV